MSYDGVTCVNCGLFIILLSATIPTTNTYMMRFRNDKIPNNGNQARASCILYVGWITLYSVHLKCAILSLVMPKSITKMKNDTLINTNPYYILMFFFLNCGLVRHQFRLQIKWGLCSIDTAPNKLIPYIYNIIQYRHCDTGYFGHIGNNEDFQSKPHVHVLNSLEFTILHSVYACLCVRHMRMNSLHV